MAVYEHRILVRRLPWVNLGPVVQSIVSLKSSFMTNSLTVVAKIFSNALIFSLQNVTHFFSKNINVFVIFQDRNFNFTLANNFV